MRLPTGTILARFVMWYLLTVHGTATLVAILAPLAAVPFADHPSVNGIAIGLGFLFGLANTLAVVVDLACVLPVGIVWAVFNGSLDKPKHIWIAPASLLPVPLLALLLPVFGAHYVDSFLGTLVGMAIIPAIPVALLSARLIFGPPQTNIRSCNANS